MERLDDSDKRVDPFVQYETLNQLKKDNKDNGIKENDNLSNDYYSKDYNNYQNNNMNNSISNNYNEIGNNKSNYDNNSVYREGDNYAYIREAWPIGGWLIVVAGLLLYSLIINIKGFSFLNNLKKEYSSNMNISVIMVLQVIFIILFIVLIALFLQKKAIFVKASIACLAFGITIDIILYNMINKLPLYILIISLVINSVTMLYLIMSDRVKHTFIN